MKTGKTVLVTFLLVSLVSLSSAVSFGSYPVKSSKQTRDLSTSFSIGLLNPDNTVAEVRLSAPESSDYNVTFTRQRFEVEPSPVTQSPSGGGWYHLGDGRYARVRQAEFQLDISRFRSSNTVKIPVTVRAFNPGGSGTTSSDMVYVREHVFTAEVVGRQPARKEDGTEVDWVEEDESSDRPVVELGNGSKTYKPARETGETGGSGVETTTMALLLAIAAVTVYIYRVIK